MDASEPGNLAPGLSPRLSRKLAWRLNRLRCMTPAEVAGRVLRALQARAERSGWLAAHTVPEPDLTAVANAWVHKDGKADPAPYVAAADRITEGRLDVFALRGIQLGAPPRWNRDPKTGIEAPLAFGKELDYRDPGLVGDIKYLWEPNRHQHLVTLAQAYALTQRRAYLDTIVEHLDSWFIACPYGYGPNWASSLEVALRLISWASVWQLAGMQTLEGHADFRDRWLKSVYEHAQFIRGWLSLHSSANNHLIGEAAGLFIAALAWPHWPAARGWAATGKLILEREALAQNAPDGVNREQAIWYQQFVLDLMVTALLAGKANGQWFSADYESRVEVMLDFIASVMDAGGNVPMLGDGDDGFATNLSSEQPYRSLLALGAILFKRGDYKLKARSLDDRARWLLGAGADAAFERLNAEATRLPLRQAFPDGGYYVLGCEFDTPNEIRLVADAGPLGYRSIAAHGHADALSFTLSAGGAEFLIDPGTYAYHTQERWRQYFRGTAAHNTLRIDGLDQSVAGGSFMWLKKARAACSLWLSSADQDSFEGWHDGYMRLDDPVKHRRLIQLQKSSRRVLIEDTLEMEEEHDVELFFHCAERCKVDEVPGGFAVSQGALSTRIVLPSLDGAAAAVLRGSLAPVAGWVSRAFDRREPTATIVWRARLSGPVRLRTEIAILLSDH